MTPDPIEADDKTEELTFTRRTALALLGASGATGIVSGSTNAKTGDAETKEPERKWNQNVDAQGHDLRNLGSAQLENVHTAARNADRVVWKDEEGVFHADGPHDEVAAGEEMLEVINAALESLTDGRTSKEKVVIASPGTLGPFPDDEGIFELEIPSYTILDVPVTLRVEDEGENLFFVRARDAEHIDIPNFNLVGNPRYGLWLQSVDNVHLGDINIAFENAGEVGLGVRIDEYGQSERRSSDVQIDSGYVENSGHHAFETNGVDRFQAGTLIANDPANGGLNMNHTIDATINSVVGFDPGHPSTYATVRLANFCHNVSVGQVVSRGGAKGLMLITAHNASFGEVNIEGSTDSGIFATLSTDVSISGGVIKNCRGEAIRIHGYPQETFPFNVPTEGITVSNVRIFDSRPEDERTQTYAIRESGETAFNNQFVDNDVRDGGTEEIISVASSSTAVVGNIGAGIASGTTTLSPGEDVAARVTEISPREDVTLELRAKPREAPDARFSWDEYFEWDPEASAWELVVEWRTDPGEAVTLDYIVDRPQANLGRRGYEGNWKEYAADGTEDPHV
ncbi:right-handed parallel beta-helix repeat-containing protein [Halomontanus rarus]|uniref:right-handed parallel beta-helix repeat-containing protein n=1 Tax=Halomontanus rarus TaxID=3034020 RepID=UPI001A98276B